MSLGRLAASIAGRSDSSLRRVEGTAVYLFSQPGLAPPSLLSNMRANGSLHTQVYVVTVVTDDQPVVLPARRVRETPHGQGLFEVMLHYGFMEQTPVAEDLRLHLGIDPVSTYYFLGRESVRPTDRHGMARWRESLFALMSRNASDVASYFSLPPERVVEIGSRIDI